MSDFYQRLQQTAIRLVGEYGLPMTFIESYRDYDPITDKAATTSSLTVTTNGVLLEVAQSLVDGSAIEKGRKVFILDPKEKPLMGWRFDADSIPVKSVSLFPGSFQSAGMSGMWSVVEIKTIAPGGVPLLYEVQVSK